MWKPNLLTLHQFIQFYRNLSVPRHLLTSGSLLLVLLYPGTNSFSPLIIHPGSVLSYALPSANPVPYPASDQTSPPRTSATSIVIQDVQSKTLIYTRQPDVLIFPASTTKIMTALVALDAWPNLDTVLTVQNEDRAIGQTIELVKGEQLTVQSLLSGLLIHSGNDAALALADNYPGGYSAFVTAMNRRAQSLHLDSTVYKNPSGIEQYGHVTTARDLAILAGVAMQNSTIAEIVGQREVTITDVTGEHSHHLVTTNELLGVLSGLRGLKTGWTEHSGECLISYVERDGHAIIVVVMGSTDRFGDTTALVNWAYAHHSWIIPEL